MIFGGIPSTGSRDIVGTRICHADVNADADTDADTNGSALKPICAPLTFGGGTLDIFSENFIYLNPHVTVKIISRSPKPNQLLSLSQSSGKFGRVQSTCS